MALKKTLIFIHIPKTAGTTFARVFKENYIFWPKNWVYMGSGLEKTGPLEAMSVSAREKIRLVHGHVSFGVHDLLPQDAVYVTCLRDPVKRVLSFYNYIFTNPRHYLYDPVAKEKMRFGDFINSGLTCELDNLQVRMLSGDENEVSFGDIDSEHFERAKSNIEFFFPVVGLSEYFDESLLLMRDVLDWRFFPFYVRGKVNTDPLIKPGELDEKTIGNVLSLNQWDQKLYEWAKTRLESQIEEAGSGFKRRVANYKYMNKLFQQVVARLPVYRNT